MKKRIKKKLTQRRLGKGFSIKSIRGFPAEEVDAFEKSGEFHFWLIHGLNYLHSDFNEGIWSPLYDIYGGKLPEVEEVKIKISNKFTKGNDLTPIGKILGIWLSQTPGELYSIFRNILFSIKKTTQGAEVLLREPYFPPLWEIFQLMKDRSLKLVAA